MHETDKHQIHNSIISREEKKRMRYGRSIENLNCSCNVSISKKSLAEKHIKNMAP